MLKLFRSCLFLNILVAPLVLLFSLTSRATVDLGTEMTNDCQTSVSTIQVLDNMLSQNQIPIYFNANCGPGGTATDGTYYRNSVQLQMTVSDPVQVTNDLDLGYELTNSCPITVSTLNILNNLLEQQDIQIYLSSQCGPGGVATNGQSYNNSVSVNLNVNSVINPQ